MRSEVYRALSVTERQGLARVLKIDYARVSFITEKKLAQISGISAGSVQQCPIEGCYCKLLKPEDYVK